MVVKVTGTPATTLLSQASLTVAVMTAVPLGPALITMGLRVRLTCAAGPTVVVKGIVPLILPWVVVMTPVPAEWAVCTVVAQPAAMVEGLGEKLPPRSSVKVTLVRSARLLSHSSLTLALISVVAAHETVTAEGDITIV